MTAIITTRSGHRAIPGIVAGPLRIPAVARSSRQGWLASRDGWRTEGVSIVAEQARVQPHHSALPQRECLPGSPGNPQTVWRKHPRRRQALRFFLLVLALYELPGLMALRQPEPLVVGLLLIALSGSPPRCVASGCSAGCEDSRRLTSIGARADPSVAKNSRTVMRAATSVLRGLRMARGRGSAALMPELLGPGSVSDARSVSVCGGVSVIGSGPRWPQAAPQFGVRFRAQSPEPSPEQSRARSRGPFQARPPPAPSPAPFRTSGSVSGAGSGTVSGRVSGHLGPPLWNSWRALGIGLWFRVPVRLWLRLRLRVRGRPGRSRLAGSPTPALISIEAA